MLLKGMLIVLMVLVEWAVLFGFFSCIVWFEMWVIGCREYSEVMGIWDCLPADTWHDSLGFIVEALPSICEGVFFELILAISKIIARRFISHFEFPTLERRDFAIVSVIFFLEVVGKIGFVFLFAFAFVTPWSDTGNDACRRYWDYYVLGESSLACLKGKIPFEVRLNMLTSAMKGPMLVSGLVGIGVKTLLPFLLEKLRCFCRCQYFFCPVCFAPANFLLRALVLIFQADYSAVGGHQMLFRWPPTLEKQGLSFGGLSEVIGSRCDGEDLEHNTVLSKTSATESDWLSSALLEGQRREYEPFDEYIELLLHFLWLLCFGFIWPFGCICALMNQFLEYRFDCMKLLCVRRRRIPSTRHMSVVWVPSASWIICHVGIIVNAALVTFPYRLPSHIFPVDCMPRTETVANWPISLATFALIWILLLVLRWLVSSNISYLCSV